jgi:hypothetical protein
MQVEDALGLSLVEEETVPISNTMKPLNDATSMLSP